MSNAELAEILKKHAAWFKDSRDGYDLKFANDPRRANLCGALLKGVDLTASTVRRGPACKPGDANLGFADLAGEHLERAHLTDADRSFANVADAEFDFDPDAPP